MKKDLKQMYGSTPESFQRRVSFALKQTEAKLMKRKVSAVLVIAIVVALSAAAYAAFSSQVAEFFGKSYGRDWKEWLEEGDVATVDQSYTLNGVVFTLDEVVYRSNGLYGVGTIRPADGSGDVVIAMDHTPDEPFGYDIHGEGGCVEEAPAGTPTLAEAAAAQGGRLLEVSALLDQVGVDGGEMLTPGCVGMALVPQRDGSIQFSFEVESRSVVQEGDVYTILMESTVCEMTADGERLDDTQQIGTWTVEISPEPMNGETAEATPTATPATAAQTLDGITLTVPDEYTQTGTLPVYTAVERDFGADLQPELFNQSGVASEESYLITFNDEAQLSWAPEALFYCEYQGTYNSNYKNPEQEPSYIPLKTITNAASDLAGDVYSNWPGDGKYWEGITLDQTALSGITLDEAKAKLETLLAALHVEGYTCDYALDMSVSRIQSMGVVMNELIEENEYWNSAIVDYSQATEADEGFYLHYQNGIETGDGRFDVYAYVTADGVADLQVRDQYIRGDVAETPASLVAPETVLAALPVEMADSHYSEMTLDSVSSIELIYTPTRAADRTEGMVFTPAWYITYRDAEGAAQDYDCFAIFNAVNGELLAASFE